MAARGPYFNQRGKTIRIGAGIVHIDGNGNPIHPSAPVAKARTAAMNGVHPASVRTAPKRAPVKAGTKLVSKARKFVPKKVAPQVRRASGPADARYGTDASGNALTAGPDGITPVENGAYADFNGSVWAGQISSYDQSFTALEPQYNPPGGLTQGNLYQLNGTQVGSSIGPYDTTDSTSTAPPYTPPAYTPPPSSGIADGTPSPDGQSVWSAQYNAWVPNPSAQTPYSASPYAQPQPYPYATPQYAPPMYPQYAAPPPAYPMYPAAPLPGQDPNALLYAGAAYGAETAQAQAQQGAYPGMDPLTMSIMMGGGYSDPSGLTGMSGGLDATTLAMLSGGDPNAALQMAMQNGGYDPGSDGGDDSGGDDGSGMSEAQAFGVE